MAIVDFQKTPRAIAIAPDAIPVPYFLDRKLLEQLVIPSRRDADRVWDGCPKFQVGDSRKRWVLRDDALKVARRIGFGE